MSSNEIQVTLSDGEAYLKPFINNEIATKYKEVLYKDIQRAAFEPSEADLKEIEALPILERMKVKKDLSVGVPMSNVEKAMDFLAFEMTTRLVVGGVTKPAVRENLNKLDQADFNKIREKAAEIWLEFSEKVQSKKKS